MLIPIEVLEQVSRRNLVVCIGSAFAKEAGVPSLQDLLSQLAEQMGYGKVEEKRLLSITEKYRRRNSQVELVNFLLQKSPPKTVRLPRNLQKLSLLEAQTWITTNLDTVLEQSLLDQGIKFSTILEDSDLPYASSSLNMVIKLNGDFSRPQSLVLTEIDHDLYSNKNPQITNKIASLLQERLFLLFGFQPSDPLFEELVRLIYPMLHQNGHYAYAFLDDPDEDCVDDLEIKHIRTVRFNSAENPGSLSEIMDTLIDQLPKTPSTPTVDLVRYKKWLHNETDLIDIREIKSSEKQEILRFPLLKLYIELHVIHTRDLLLTGMINSDLTSEERIPLSKLVEQSHDNLVIIGDPVSGKTTFLRYLSRVSISNPNPNAPLPILIRANHFSAFIHARGSKNLKLDSGPVEKLILQYLLEMSGQYDWGFHEDWLVDQAQQGKFLFLMDGMDEIITPKEREDIICIVDATVNRWEESRWILTSRPNVLLGKAKPANFAQYFIDGLGNEEIKAFIFAWASFLFDQSTSSERSNQSLAYANDLYRAIQNRPDIRLLARYPGMLTIMAVIHWNARRLPEGRADLYEAVLADLITKHHDDPNLIDAKKARRCYQLLAFAMFQNPGGRIAQIGFHRAAEIIAHMFDGDMLEDKVQAAITFLEQEEISTGILVRRGVGNLVFRHLTFQEYLAACEIASKTDIDNADGWWSYITSHLQDPEWQEVLRFFPTRLIMYGDDRVNLFIERVLDTRKGNSLAETARVIGILGFVLYDLSVYRYQVSNVKAYTDARDKVMAIFNKKGLSLDINTRYEAAVALGRGGDPRLMNPDDLWVRIPKGVQRIGAQNADPNQPNHDEDAAPNESPVHEVYTASFEIGKYPVTVQEYTQFIKDNGYQDAALWSPEGWRYRENRNITTPDQWDLQLLFPNCPVVYVSWYEAEAYCNWLSRKNPGMVYRLPTEAEWEYNARRGQESYTRYCFGHVPAEKVLFEISSEICQPTHLRPVGMFPLDISKDGVSDMNGNVMNWVLDAGGGIYLSEPVQANRVIDCVMKGREAFHCARGGSWFEIMENCRSASRKEYLSDIRKKDLSFRVLRRLDVISIKGQRPVEGYQASLPDVNAKDANQFYMLEKTEERLKDYTTTVPGLSTSIITRLFPQQLTLQPRPYDRLPCIMRDNIEKFEFNLYYQDSRIKLAVEEKLGKQWTPRHDQDAKAIAEIVSIFLQTRLNDQGMVWQNLTDNDLDAMIFQILDRYDPARPVKLLEYGHLANRLALGGLRALQPDRLEEIIEHQVFAGVIWWKAGVEDFASQFAGKGSFEINDIDPFKADTLNPAKSTHLLFFFDDNGELVWDLWLIFYLLGKNPHLTITGVVSGQIIANNSSRDTLDACLQDPLLKSRRSQFGDRFNIFVEENFRSAIDLAFCSETLMEMLRQADVAYFKGVALFETMQKLPVKSYYAFVVHSMDSQLCTGLKPGSGVFVRIPEGKAGYYYQKDNLKQLYRTFKEW